MTVIHAKSRKFALIANPLSGSGSGQQLILRIEAMLKQQGISWQLFATRYHAHALSIARELAPTEFDGIVSVGGDGTNFHVLNGLLQNHHPETLPPLGIIPVGKC